MVPAAVDFLCNASTSLADKDAAARALAALSEADKPREAILASQAALDGLAGLLERWDGEDGGAQVRKPVSGP